MQAGAGNADKQLNSNVIAALERLLDSNYLPKKYTYRICEASDKGDNFIGIVYRVIIEVGDESGEPKRVDGPDVENLNRIIIKVAPKNAARRKQCFARPCFLRETQAYVEFLPLVKSFQYERNIHGSASFHEYPECYHTITEEMNEAIFIEDMCLKNFRLFDRFGNLTKDHVNLVMKAYAKLHAVSFAIRDQEPDKLKPFCRMLDIFAQQEDDQFLKSYFEDLKQYAIESLNPVTDRKYVEILKKYFERGTFLTILLELLNPQRCEPFAVVCHGDCWNNNILYRTENNSVQNVCLLDWQIMRYASPITDIMYFLYTCTTKSLRDQYYQHFLNTYYETLANHIKDLKSNPEKLFPHSVFVNELQVRGVIGLFFAMILLPFSTMKGEDMPDLDTLSVAINTAAGTDFQQLEFFTDKSRRNHSDERMRDVVLSIVDLGYIPCE